MTPVGRRRAALRRVAVTCALALATAVHAADPDCDTPSGNGTHACVFPEGQVVVESNLIDRTIDRAGGLHSAGLLVGDTLAHVGISHRVEAQIGWNSYDYERTLDLRIGRTTISRGVGQITLGGKVALISDDEGPLGLAVQPNLFVPVQSRALGGGVGGEVLVPLSYALSDLVTAELTPTLDLSGNRDSNGRHLEYGAVAGADVTIVADTLTATAEYTVLRDRDPSFHRTKQLGGLSFSVVPVARWQITGGVAVGLNRSSPRSELMIGLARHFL